MDSGEKGMGLGATDPEPKPGEVNYADVQAAADLVAMYVASERTTSGRMKRLEEVLQEFEGQLPSSMRLQPDVE